MTLSSKRCGNSSRNQSHAHSLAINALTIVQIKVNLLSNEEEGDQTQGEPMDTKIEVEGQPLSSRSRGKQSRASSSSTIPLDAFQIILEMVDGL